MIRLRMKIADWLRALAFVIDDPGRDWNTNAPFGELYWETSDHER